MSPAHSQSRTKLSPWVTLVERTFTDPQGPLSGAYHCLAVHDYVSVLAVTADGKVPLVRQYRPAVDRVTLELPGGLVDNELSPSRCAEAELLEETGYRLTSPLRELGCLDPDTGRLENRFWAFFAADIVPVENWEPEAGVERVMWSREQLLSGIARGEFTTAMHVALVGLAMLKQEWGVK